MWCVRKGIIKMDVYSKLLIEGAILIALIILTLWVILKKSVNNWKLNIRDASLSSEELEGHAKKIATEHTLSLKRSTVNWPLPRVKDNYDFIFSVYKGLNEDIQKKYSVPDSAEWLLDNFYIIEEQTKELKRDLNKKSYFRLPVLKSGFLKGYARIFAIAVELVAHTDGQMDEKILEDYLNAYQSNSVLFDREVWALPLVIRLALIENIRHLCENIQKTQEQWHKADDVFHNWMLNENFNSNQGMYSFKGSLKSVNISNPSFVEHLMYHLRRSGRSYTKVLSILDEQLTKSGIATDDIIQKEHYAQSINTLSMSNSISSLRLFATLDWESVFESVSLVEQILKQDPEQMYSHMDYSTRNIYKRKIEEISYKYGVSELHIAREAILLAQQFYDKNHMDISETEQEYADDTSSKWHVGHYLLGNGLITLENRQDKIKLAWNKKNNRSASILYMGSIGLITIILVCLAVEYSFFSVKNPLLYLTIIAGIAVLIPASEIAVDIVNRIVCKTIKPAYFPRLDLKDGIPESLSTVIVIPALFPDKEYVEELLNKLEGHYLSNREDNLYFALLGAFQDSDVPHMKNDEQIIQTALSGIEKLNKKYSVSGTDKFYFFHRMNQFNESNNKWISWERKRGALMEFNDLILESVNTSFRYSSCENPPFSHVKYIITLDSDTILPMGEAKKMIATMAHPLNRPVIDKEKGIVIRGYGIMQPRVEIESESSNATLFSKIFTGQEGIDPYANAISDVYQDLFKEGIFTGKGIYDLKAFQSVLKNVIPEDSVLSHDLLEGSYARTGLVTDLKLIDSFPSKYNSYVARRYRWTRGDWQLLPLLFGKFSKHNNRLPNPLSLLSKWKIFDNLRRSLVQPAILILIVLSFCILPGRISFWAGYVIAALALPFILDLIVYIFSGQFGNGKTKRHMPVIVGLKSVFWQKLLTLIFMPYQAWSMVSAIFVTMARVFVTRKNLLEWVTSADTEKYQKNSFVSYMLMMRFSVIIAPVIFLLTIILKPQATITSLFLCILWVAAPFIAYWISKDRKPAIINVSEKDKFELRRIARKTWRYFEEFANARNNYLPPDNYQADPPRGVAARTSPTNIGLGLLATLSARDLGYISTSTMIDLIDKTISTAEKMEKWCGHLFNWYDTHTMRPIRPVYVSTVDSGNFAGYLITLAEGLLGYLSTPLAETKVMTAGIRDTLYCDGKEGRDDFDKLVYYHTTNGEEKLDLVEWEKFLTDLLNSNIFDNIKEETWKLKIKSMVRMLISELDEFMPWIIMVDKIPSDLKNQDKHKEISDDVEQVISLLKTNTTLLNMPIVYMEADNQINRITEHILINDTEEYKAGLLWLEELKQKIMEARKTAEEFIQKVEDLIKRIHVLYEQMQFFPLYDPKKHLFAIGFDVDENKLTNSYYDLFASEARQASYVAIAKGEIPPEHWFCMSRSLTAIDKYKGLVSWSGTMFEYLMPLLIMKNYENTLLDETYSFVIKSQKKYGRQRNMPWGFSESAYNLLDLNLDYQYKAIGVPWLGLKRGLIDDAVTAPYASFLALLVDPEGAIQNIKYLKKEGLEGPYGLYEAADYTPERLLFDNKTAIIKSFMAHHQGMSLLALDNFLHDNIMQKRFHADPSINAARILLQEKVPANISLIKEEKEKVLPLKEGGYKEKSSVRKFHRPNPILPKVHILSNGNYSVMITDRGTGYSKNKMVSVTRWREDSVLDSFGTFFYLHNIDTNELWSTTYAPLNVMPDKYEVVFMSDKAVFKRTDGNIETQMEVMVASGDNVEIRKISLKNHGTKDCIIELTSYCEIVLAPKEADIAHPAFSNLFIETEFSQDKNCVIAHRRPRAETDKSLWIANAMLCKDGSTIDVQYETDRMQFIGRGNTTKMPLVMERGKPLLNTVGPVLDPVMSLRIRIKVPAGKAESISFISAVSESNESLLLLMDKYSGSDAVDKAFRLALTRSQVETKYLNLDALETELYQNLMSHILFISPTKRKYEEEILQSEKGQSSLWSYGISGDLPIVFVTLKNSEQMEILYDILKAHEYWQLMDLKVDLVLLCEEENSYLLPLHALVADIVLSRKPHNNLKRLGEIFILDKNKMSQENIYLFYECARLIFEGGMGTLAEQITVQKYLIPKEKQFSGVEAEFIQPVFTTPKLVCPNGLGGFSEDGSEYIIQLEKNQKTPLPWTNVIANPIFGFTVSESGSGYSWYENSHENKISPWSNDMVSDNPDEMLYIVDGDTGKQWTVTSLPIREEEPYRITHGFGYSVFEHTSHGIEQKLTQFVPVDESVKISMLSLKNDSNQKRNLTLTYYIRPVLGSNEQLMAPHIITSLDESGVFLIENPYNEDFRGKLCFLDASITRRFVTGNRKEFFGAGDIYSPDCLSRENLSGAVGTGFDSCGSIQVHISLEVNESREIVFLLGMAVDIQQVNKITSHYHEIKNAKEAFADVKRFWKEKMDTIKVETPVASMNLMLNGWLQYQIISCRLWARTGFYQSGGAFGFRDQLQDCLSIAHLSPEITRAQIIRHAKHQFTQGDVEHWWHEPQEKGVRTRCSDDRLWLVFVTAEYIRITGDIEILQEEIPFLEEEILPEYMDEKYGSFQISDMKKSLFEHCVRAIDISLQFGKHGLPLIGTGDWNDGMNTVGNKGEGESVWLGWFLASVLKMFSPYCKRMGEDELADKYLQIERGLIVNIEKEAWDGNWYKRAYFDDGEPLGSVQNEDCKIDSIAQTWAVISDEGNEKRAKIAMNSLEDYLINKEDGIIKLLAPPFDKGDMEPGYIKGYVPGVRENGGQYTHAAAWVVIAFAKLKDGNKAEELFELMNPINHTENIRECFRYKAEPYVMAADVYAAYPHAGRGGWTWYTGSAGWTYRAGLEYILGFQKNADEIILDPCIPAKWETYAMNYKFKDTQYVIHINNPDGCSTGVKCISTDGVIENGNRIHLINDGKTHVIDALMGVSEV